MLQYETAKKLYDEISEKASKCTKEGFDDFYREFLQDATDYAVTRLNWFFMNQSERNEDDASRSIKHDGFMSLLTAVCRNLEITGIDDILPDRKTKGDFACYIALFLALGQR